MSNFLLFSTSSILTSLAFELIFYFCYFYVFSLRTLAFDYNSLYSLYFFVNVLTYQISGLAIDKLKNKSTFVLIDFAYALFLSVVLFYFKIGEIKPFYYLFLLSISAIFNSFCFTATRSIIPSICNIKDRIKFNSMVISVINISKIVGFIFYLTFNEIIVPYITFSASILFFISAILKSFIVVKEVEIQKETFLNYVSAGWSIVFKKKTIFLSILTQVISMMFFFSLFSTIVPYLIKTSLENSSTEIMNNLNISANLKPAIAFNIPLFVMLLLLLFISIGSIFYVTFCRIHLAFEGDPYGKEGGRLLDYFLLPFCLIAMLCFIYSSFFQRNYSLQTVLFCFKEHNFYLNFINFLNTLQLVVLVMSIIFFVMFKDKLKVIKGMKFMQYSFLPLCALMSFLVLYFGTMGRGNILNLLFFLTILTPVFIFALTANLVYLTNLYQSIIPSKKLGRFISVLITLSLGSNFLGKKMYGFMIDYIGLFSVALILILASLLNLFVFKKFEKECDKETKI